VEEVKQEEQSSSVQCGYKGPERVAKVDRIREEVSNNVSELDCRLVTITPVI
jgi:hypothetical protein